MSILYEITSMLRGDGFEEAADHFDRLIESQGQFESQAIVTGKVSGGVTKSLKGLALGAGATAVAFIGAEGLNWALDKVRETAKDWWKEVRTGVSDMEALESATGSLTQRLTKDFTATEARVFSDLLQEMSTNARETAVEASALQEVMPDGIMSFLGRFRPQDVVAFEMFAKLFAPKTLKESATWTKAIAEEADNIADSKEAEAKFREMILEFDRIHNTNLASILLPAKEKEQTLLDKAIQKNKQLKADQEELASGALSRLVLIERQNKALQDQISFTKFIENLRQQGIQPDTTPTLEGRGPLFISPTDVEKGLESFKEYDKAMEKFFTKSRGYPEGFRHVTGSMIDSINKWRQAKQDDIEETKVWSDSINDMLAGGLSSGLSEFAGSIGDLGGAAITFENVSAQISNTMGRTAENIGQFMVATAVASKFIKEWAKANPKTAIVAGFALIALGRRLQKYSAKQMQNLSGGGGGSDGGSGLYFGEREYPENPRNFYDDPLGFNARTTQAQTELLAEIRSLRHDGLKISGDLRTDRGAFAAELKRAAFEDELTGVNKVN